MAITGASVIAVTPVASNLPALEAAQQRAVDLVAFENPFAVLGGTLSTAFQNLSNRGGDINATLIPNLSAILGNAELQREISVLLFRPETVTQQIADRWAEHAETIRLGQEQSDAGGAAHLALLDGVIQRAQAELAAGHFTEAFAHLNDWFIFGLGAVGWPLYPSFEVPGKVARAVGGPAIAAILDAVLVGDTTLAGYPHAILVPFVSAIFRMTDSFDEIRAAAVAGDVVTAVSHLINLPVKVLGAFLNGYTPSIAPEWSVFPGILTAGGPIDSFLVQYPTLIAKALGLLPATAQTAEEPAEEPTAALSRVSSTDLVSDAEVVTLSVETAEDAAAPVEPVSATTEVEEVDDTVGAPVETVATEPVVTEAEGAVVEVEGAEPGSTETADDTSDDTTVTESTSDTESDTESDSKADVKDDAKADAKDDAKADAKDDAKADAKSDSKDDAKADTKSDSKSDNSTSSSDSGSSSE